MLSRTCTKRGKPCPEPLEPVRGMKRSELYAELWRQSELPSEVDHVLNPGAGEDTSKSALGAVRRLLGLQCSGRICTLQRCLRDVRLLSLALIPW